MIPSNPVFTHKPRMGKRDRPHYQSARPTDIALSVEQFGAFDVIVRQRLGRPLLLLDRWADMGVSMMACIGGANPDTVDDALDPNSMFNDMMGTVCVANAVCSLQFAAADRPEADWSAIDREDVYQYLIENLIARGTHRAFADRIEVPLNFGQDDLGDMRRAHEIDADRKAWEAIYPGEAMPRRKGVGTKREADRCVARWADRMTARKPKSIDADPTKHMPSVAFEHGLPLVDPYWHCVRVRNAVTVALALRDGLEEAA